MTAQKSDTNVHKPVFEIDYFDLVPVCASSYQKSWQAEVSTNEWGRQQDSAKCVTAMFGSLTHIRNRRRRIRSAAPDPRGTNLAIP